MATGDIREGLTLLLEDCAEATAPAAAPESRRLDALADLQTEMAAVANGADASKIKRKFRAYAKRARLAHRDEVEQELAQIKQQVAACAEAEAPVAAISAALDEFDAIAEAPAPALEQETHYAKVLMIWTSAGSLSKTRNGEAVSEAVGKAVAAADLLRVLRADDPAPERDESELRLASKCELKAAHPASSASARSANRRRPGRTPRPWMPRCEDPGRPGRAKVREPSSRAPRRRPRWRSPRHLLCCHPCGACSARPLQPPARAAGPATTRRTT